jgi:hypothetical protein
VEHESTPFKLPYKPLPREIQRAMVGALDKSKLQFPNRSKHVKLEINNQNLLYYETKGWSFRGLHRLTDIEGIYVSIELKSNRRGRGNPCHRSWLLTNFSRCLTQIYSQLNQPHSNCKCHLPHIATHAQTLIRAYPGVMPATKHFRSVGLMQVAVPRPTTFSCLLVYVTSPELIY